MEKRSYAKINSYLKILSRRKDGFHEIETVFNEIDVFDVLNFTLTKNPEIRILANKPELSGEKNLIWKVASYLQKEYKIESGVTVRLKKNIPVAAGLGGGSSNAATAINVLNRLWELDLLIEEKHKIAAMFGSDINFFLIGGAAIGRGRGERITPVEDILWNNILLINPGFAVSSKDAYSSFARVEGVKAEVSDVIGSKDYNFAYNDLERPVSKLYPKVAGMIAELNQSGAKAILSGSGPTVIAFCPDKVLLDSLYDLYSQKGMWCCKTKTIKREKTDVF